VPAKKKRSKPTSPEREAIERLTSEAQRLGSLIPGLKGRAAVKTRHLLLEVIAALRETYAALDPIKEPVDTFDPSKPSIAGRLVGLALVAQPLIPMSRLDKMYGSGVYAIYYFGPHPAYQKISGTETPIYAGKADPEFSDAKTAREQGPQLYGRLKDHQKSIRTVEQYAMEHQHKDALHINDFRYRRLVVATNAQLTAERSLISLFEPIWNEDTKICWGISKHGDKDTTRANDRSPWDVLHPGRKWAISDLLKDKKSKEQIFEDIDTHLSELPPFTDKQQIIDRFLEGFKQHVELESAEEAQAAVEDVVPNYQAED
jgi:hypothetical protein